MRAARGRFIRQVALAGLGLLLFLVGRWGEAAEPLPVPLSTLPGSLPNYTASWAVIIGIDEYEDPRIPTLKYAANDAKGMEKTLLGLGFERNRIITLLKPHETTKAAIERVLADELRQKVGRDDRVLVFFAGHGKTETVGDESEGYLLPFNANPDLLYSTAIGMRALRDISYRLPAKHVLYIVDACYSGYAMYNRSMTATLREEMLKKRAIQVLTAGRQEDAAQEVGGHGVFTEVLLRGLQGEAFSGKGWLSLEDLGPWVRDRVSAETNGRQRPQFGSLHGEGQFVFDRVQAGATSPGPASWPLMASVSFTESSAGWAIGECAPGTSLRCERRIVDGKYRWDVTFGGNVGEVYAVAPYGPLVNFYFSADATFVAHQSPAEVTLFFGYASRSAYGFKIASDGRFSLVRYEGDQPAKETINWTPVNLQAKGQINAIAVIVENQHFRLYLNEQMIGEYRDPAFTGGTVGLQVSGNAGEIVVVDFDNFVLRRAPSLPTPPSPTVTPANPAIPAPQPPPEGTEPDTTSIEATT
jgi:hypothetical protein